MNVEYKIRAFDNLRTCCGHVQNASDTTVKIHQDDATGSFIVKVGSKSYWGNGLSEALENAAADHED